MIPILNGSFDWCYDVYISVVICCRITTNGPGSSVVIMPWIYFRKSRSPSLRGTTGSSKWTPCTLWTMRYWPDISFARSVLYGFLISLTPGRLSPRGTYDLITSLRATAVYNHSLSLWSAVRLAKPPITLYLSVDISAFDITFSYSEDSTHCYYSFIRKMSRLLPERICLAY